MHFLQDPNMEPLKLRPDPGLALPNLETLRQLRVANELVFFPKTLHFVAAAFALAFAFGALGKTQHKLTVQVADQPMDCKSLEPRYIE